MIRVLIADDYGPMRQAMSGMLSRAGDIEVAGACGSPGQVVTFLETNLPPDVLVIEQRFFNHHLIQALQKFPSVKVVITSMHHDNKAMSEVTKRGAHGFVLKTHFDTHLVLAIRSVYEGRVYYGLGGSTSQAPEPNQ
jgi:DNA-binding NarL/FixJ family response regulator